MPGILALPRLARLVELGPLEWPRSARTFIGLSLFVKLFLEPQLDQGAGNRGHGKPGLDHEIASAVSVSTTLLSVITGFRR